MQTLKPVKSEEQRHKKLTAFNLKDSLQVITDTQSDMHVSPRLTKDPPEPVTLLKSPTQENLFSQPMDHLDFRSHQKVTYKNTQSAGNVTEPSISADDLAGKENNENRPSIGHGGFKFASKAGRASKNYPPVCKVLSTGEITHDFK